ncbi:MAG: 16S rRNA (cytosine(1402)-N(4))-methyltransferase RsmH [Planctomycetota bacterium]|nr:16S rRNA (cytosine(1402)-N(4))-methyltransferase RsmH [Planctomycetota bacterium]
MSDQVPHGHDPVLVGPILRLLAPVSGDTVVDATAGRGGHAELFARALNGHGRLILGDLDSENLTHAVKRVEAISSGVTVTPWQGNFTELPIWLGRQAISADVFLADLGFSTNQVLNPTRGFSFREDGPLDMRLSTVNGATAADLVAALPEDRLADLIFQLGEDPFARRIARKIAQERQKNPILTTVQLASVVREAYGPRAGQSRMHPATRTFMALRIAVNDELGALTRLLDQLDEAAQRAHSKESGWLRRGARIGIVSFHSLEDRLVKRWCVKLVEQGVAETLTRKPEVADDTEVRHNPRARSAKFRALRLV